jgi:hypothetical protein
MTWAIGDWVWHSDSQEERTWREHLARLAEVQPELTPLLVAYVTQRHQLPERLHTVVMPQAM